METEADGIKQKSEPRRTYQTERCIFYPLLIFIFMHLKLLCTCVSHINCHFQRICLHSEFSEPNDAGDSLEEGDNHG